MAVYLGDQRQLILVELDIDTMKLVAGDRYANAIFRSAHLLLRYDRSLYPKNITRRPSDLKGETLEALAPNSFKMRMGFENTLPRHDNLVDVRESFHGAILF
ncbi:MAG: hypothetical protein H0V90_11735 [Blastocatellia bacterium]|nr:hypothetical protein [Blastocatellia bacterium]